VVRHWTYEFGQGVAWSLVTQWATPANHKGEWKANVTQDHLGVLILHGFTSSLDTVKPVASAVRELGLPTRMPILEGHGAQSPEALRGVTWHDWLADAEAALQELLTEAEQAIVFGHSEGDRLVREDGTPDVPRLRTPGCSRRGG
jgi:alpha-beta hydrolase superfamily lysophospholipase